LERAFNSGKIILAGAFPAFGSTFLDQVRQSFQEFCHSEKAMHLVVSDLGEFNGALGAAALAVHEWKPVADKS
jgi:hypothetical protein